MSRRPEPALVRAWDAKLKASGFRDIEARLPTSEREYNIVRKEITSSYDDAYWRAVHLYTEWNAWTSTRERQAWFLYAEGKTIREIRTELHCWNNWLVDTLHRHRERMVANIHRLGEVLEDWWDDGADDLDVSA